MFRNVGFFNSLCKGTTVPTVPFGVSLRKTTWLPRWRTALNPNLLHRIFRQSLPEIFLSVGTLNYLKCGKKRRRLALGGKFFQVQFSSFFQVFKGLVYGGALAGSANLSACSHIKVFFFLNNCCKCLHTIYEGYALFKSCVDRILLQILLFGQLNILRADLFKIIQHTLSLFFRKDAEEIAKTRVFCYHTLHLCLWIYKVSVMEKHGA